MLLRLAGHDAAPVPPPAATDRAELLQGSAGAASVVCTGSPADGNRAASINPDPRRGGQCYDVFISHAGTHKDQFAFWLRQEVLRTCGRRAFLDETDLQLCDDAPGVIHAALRTAIVVVAVITEPFVRSRSCLDELAWACQQRKRQLDQGLKPLAILPVFYRDLDPKIGFGPDRCRDTAAVRRTLQEHHMGAREDEHEQWREALQLISTLTGLRQNSFGRRASRAHLPGIATITAAAAASHVVPMLQHTSPANMLRRVAVAGCHIVGSDCKHVLTVEIAHPGAIPSWSTLSWRICSACSQLRFSPAAIAWSGSHSRSAS